MVASNYNRSQNLLFGHEGGYSNHPDDRGGATNLGVTQRTLSGWRGANATVDDVKNLTREEAAQIYRARYWNAVQADLLPSGVDHAAFDFAVNSGPGMAVRKLQEVVGTTPDGRMGPKTFEAINNYPGGKGALIRDYLGARQSFGRKLHNYNSFKKGWENRWSRVEQEASAIANNNSLTDQDTQTSQAKLVERIPIPPRRPDFLGQTPAEIQKNFLNTQKIEQLKALSEYDRSSNNLFGGTQIVPSGTFVPLLYNNEAQGLDESREHNNSLQDDSIRALLFDNRPLGLDQEFSPIDEPDEIPTRFTERKSEREEYDSRYSPEKVNQVGTVIPLLRMFGKSW